jgi:hypothetical protein
MQLVCPQPSCRADNEWTSEFCRRCETPLRSYARLAAFPALLFNRGLRAAREGRLAEARDHFAAVILWCPLDVEARNAFALACYCLGDKAEAGAQWEHVLERSRGNAAATQALAALDAESQVPPNKPKPDSRRRKRR